MKVKSINTTIIMLLPLKEAMKTPLFFISIISITLLTMAAIQQTTDRKVMSTKQAFALLEKDTNVVVLDVRTPEEYKSETGHLKGSILIPVQELESRLKELEPMKNKTVIAICRSGNRSARAAALLNQKGYKAVNLEGGILKWNAEGLPVVKEKN